MCLLVYQLLLGGRNISRYSPSLPIHVLVNPRSHFACSQSKLRLRPLRPNLEITSHPFGLSPHSNSSRTFSHQPELTNTRSGTDRLWRLSVKPLLVLDTIDCLLFRLARYRDILIQTQLRRLHLQSAASLPPHLCAKSLSAI